MSELNKIAPGVEKEAETKRPEPVSLSLLARICESELLPPQPFINYKDYFPVPFKVFLFGIYNIFWYGLGLYLFYYVYNEGLTSTFVSLDVGAGPPTCKEIPIFLNGYFQADENGNWRSSKRFNPNKVMYGVILEGVQVTQKTWGDVMVRAYDMMKPISDLGAQRDFAWNTVMWASGNSKFKISEKFSSYGSGKFQIFPEATADRIFYDTEIQSAGWSNSDGVCFNHTSRGFFDIPTKSIVIQTNLCPEGFCKDNQFAHEMYCPSLFQPTQFGYSERKSSSPTLDIRIDTRSLTTALAVNMGILSISDLSMVERDDQFDKLISSLVKRNFFTAQEATYFRPFYDSRFIPMDPVYCIVTPAKTEEYKAVPANKFSDDQAPWASVPGYNPTKDKSTDDYNATDDDFSFSDDAVSATGQIAVYMSIIMYDVDSSDYNGHLSNCSAAFSEIIAGLFDDDIADVAGTNYSHVSAEHIVLDPDASLTKQDSYFEIYFWVVYNFTDQPDLSDAAAMTQVVSILAYAADDTSALGLTTRLQQAQVTRRRRLLQIDNPFSNATVDSEGLYYYFFQPIGGENEEYDDGYYYYETIPPTCECDIIIKEGSLCGDELCSCGILSQDPYNYDCSACDCDNPDVCTAKSVLGTTKSCSEILLDADLATQQVCEDYDGVKFYCNCAILEYYGEGESDSICAGCNFTYTNPNLPEESCADSQLPNGFKTGPSQFSLSENQLGKIRVPEEIRDLQMLGHKDSSPKERMQAPFHDASYRASLLPRLQDVQESKKRRAKDLLIERGNVDAPSELVFRDGLYHLQEKSSQTPKFSAPFALDKAVCLVRQADTFFFPFMTSSGQSPKHKRKKDVLDQLRFLPKPCLPWDHDAGCENFDVMVGLVYFFPVEQKAYGAASDDGAWKEAKPPTVKPDGQFYKFAKDVQAATQKSVKDGDLYLTNASFDAMAITNFIETNRLQNVEDDDSWTEVPGIKIEESWVDAFNTLCKQKCNLLSFRVLADTKTPVLNDNFYRRKESFSFKQSFNYEAPLKVMGSVTPTTLTEKYYSCVLTPVNSLINAAGVVSGNIDLFMVIILLGIVPLMYFSTWLMTGRRPISSYETEENDAKEGDETALETHDKLKHISEILCTLTNNPVHINKLKEMIASIDTKMVDLEDSILEKTHVSEGGKLGNIFEGLIDVRVYKKGDVEEVPKTAELEKGDFELEKGESGIPFELEKGAVVESPSVIPDNQVIDETNVLLPLYNAWTTMIYGDTNVDTTNVDKPPA